MVEFSSIRHVKRSQKRRRCDDCGHMIEVGEPYLAWWSKNEGEFSGGHAHEECSAWADAVMNCEEGRAFLEDSDPDDEDAVALAEAVCANPPSDLLRSRLPRMWLDAVDEILTRAKGETL